VETKRRPLYIVNRSVGFSGRIEPGERVFVWEGASAEEPAKKDASRD
jgi:hypothetical protein